MLPSMRHFLRFIDLDSTFDSYGFKHKVSITPTADMNVLMQVLEWWYVQDELKASSV